MFKKLVSLLLAISMMVIAFGAFAEVTPKGTLPIVNEPITLTVAIPVAAKCEDIHTNAFTLWIEEKTGIDLEIIELAPTDTATQVNTIMLSGNLPDMFMCYYFGYDELASYVDAGYITDLTEYVEEYGDEYYKFLEETSIYGNGEAHVTINGRIYGVPTMADIVTSIYATNHLMMNGLFLDALDAEMPTTLDELYDLLVRIRDEDVNGNGDPDDEIPLSGSTNRDFLIEQIGGAFQYTDKETYLKVNDGEVEFIGANDEFHQTVEFLKQLLDEGLLDPAFFTQDDAALLTLNTQEYPLIGVNGSYISNQYDASTDLMASLNIAPNLEGPDGYVSSNVITPTFDRSIVITTACENVDAAFRLADFLLSEEAAMYGRVGREGIEWAYADPAKGLNGRNGQPAKYELLKPQEWILPSTNVIWRCNGFSHVDVFNYIGEDPNGMTGRLAKAVSDYDLVAQTSNEALPQLLMDPETSAEYKELQKLICNYVNENYAKFVLGDRSMDEWDAYVQTLEEIGIERYVQIAQEAYDAMN
ncbi:MAG: extracellular solute-binding protein [Clostridia bacterium]|nr:extracellular solute-binding protein [Clostridia bacterium]